MRWRLGILACCISAGLLMAGNVLSGATFSSASSTPSTVFTAASDWVAPTVTAVVAKTTSGTATGATGYVRQGATFRVYAQVVEAGTVSSFTVTAGNLTGGSGSTTMTAGSYTAGGTTYNYASPELTAANPLAAGTKTVSLTAVDASFNTTTTSASAVVDNTAPTVSQTDPGTYLRGSVDLAATASDAGAGIESVAIQRSPASLSTWTTVCTATSSPYQCAFATTAVTDGLYDLRAIATDRAGNQATSATVTNRRVDNTAPVSVNLSAPTTYLRGSVTFTGAGTDTGSGMANLTFQYAPTGTTTWSTLCVATSPATSCTLDTTTVADGTYDIRVLAADNAGNTAPSATSTARVIDNTGPAFTGGTIAWTTSSVVTGPGGYLKQGTTYRVFANVTDATSGIATVTTNFGTLITLTACASNCTVDGVTYNYASAQQTALATLAEGSTAYTLTATDAAGNSSSLARSVFVDNTAPTVSAGAMASTVNSGASNDPAGTSGAIKPGGTYRVYATVADNPAGGSGVKSVVANIATVTGVAGDTTTLTAGSYTVNGTTYNYRSPNLTLPSGAATGNARTFTFTAKDNLDSSTTTANYSVSVDSAAPAANALASANKTGGTAGLVEQGDTLTYTVNAKIDPESLVAGWNGVTAVTVTAQFVDGGASVNDHIRILNSAGTAEIGMGTVDMGSKAFFTATSNYTSSSLSCACTLAAPTLTLTLGVPSAAPTLVSTNVSMSWPLAGTGISAPAITDMAGNLLGATVKNTGNKVAF